MKRRKNYEARMAPAAFNRSNPTDFVVYRLTVDAYHRMIEAGIFREDDRVELIHGELRVMSPIDASHAGRKNA